jgi:signal transduction histidine kinase
MQHRQKPRPVNLAPSPGPQPAKNQGTFWGQARTRILLWYLILMGFFVLVSIPLMYQFVFAEVDARVREDMEEDMELFQQLLDNNSKAKEQLGLLQNPPAQTLVIPPTTPQELKALVNVYLTRHIPEDDSFLIGFVDGKLLASSPKALPNVFQADSQLMQQWALATEADQGELPSSDQTIGTILYIVEPIEANGKPLGAFVVAHLTANERKEAIEGLFVVFQVMLWVLLLALCFSWFAAGRVLAPLKILARAAQTITDTDLAQRIPIRGGGELADLAETFNDMMDRLETAFNTQRNFINDAGHELRTPITIIRGHLEVMGGDDPEEQRETLALVLDELERMDRFVEDLILLAKAERPDFLQLQTIDLASFSEELFAKAIALADRNWQLEGVATERMVGDRQRITQAMMNLAQNATQHTTATDTISLGTNVTKDGVHFWVTDTGAGIALEDQERIFERFARAANTPRRSDGAGLGLAIVQVIVQAHGGKIHLRSQPGTGSTFTIVLPLEPSQDHTPDDSNPDR